MHNFYATDPKNIVNFEIGNKSTTCGPAATKTSKVTDTLLYIYGTKFEIFHLNSYLRVLMVSGMYP